jgi:anthranilate phosphoribosyltransferase
VEPLAHVLCRLGAERAWVVHGGDGLDELTLAGESIVAEVVEGTVRARGVRASEAGLAAAPSSVLRVSSTAEAAARLRAILAGEGGAGRDVVCLNAAAALLVAGAAPDLRAGVERARQVIDSGAATGVLERLVAFTAHHAATGRVMR